MKFSVKTVCAREYVESKQNDLIKKLCINAGDTVINANDVDIWLDGGITNGGKALLFMIPFCKPILAKSVIVNSLKIIARQSGTYILGDSNGNYVNATSRITFKTVTNNGVHIEVQFPTAITQINNDAVSCQIKYKMTFQ